MKHGPSSKRHRGGRANGRRSHYGHGQTFESNGPDVKIRGNANQVLEKYQSLARDALASGDRIAAENYLQHAEHYYRILNANNAPNYNQGDGANGSRQRGNRDQEEARAAAPAEPQEEAAPDPESAAV